MIFKPLRFRKYRLLAPGPVQLHPDVIEQLAKPMIHHRTPEFEKILKSTQDKLKLCFGTLEPVMIHAAAGSGAMESAIVNTLSPGDEIIAVVSGKFGERWAKMAQVYGIKVHTLTIPWGQAVTAEQVDQALLKNPNAKAVMTQACETSTATEHPIAEIAKVVAKRNGAVILMVDGITAIGAMPLPMNDLGIDVLISGSQKAFMLPTGISFIALSERAWKFAETSKCPKYYWDLKAEKKANEKDQTFFSSPVALIRGLDKALDHLTGMNLKRTIERTQLMAKLTREAALMMGLSVYSKSPASAVTAIELPSHIDGDELRDHIEKNYNVTLMGGQDQLKGRILRIGHLGFIEHEDLCAGLEAIGFGLQDLGFTQLTTQKIEEVSEFVRAGLENSRG